MKASAMKTYTPVLRSLVAAACVALALPMAAHAQNIAVVNGKAVPKARADALIQQVTRSGQQLPPGSDQRIRDETVLREIFAQEAERRGIPASAEYRAQLELARQSILIREMFEDFRKKNPATDAEAKTEYDKFKAQATGTEYRASHILVEKEEEAKALIAQIKGGAKFEDLAKKNSKDPGSGERGGDLDFAKPDAYVPEFGKAMAALKKGEMTDAPVKSQFGFHIIRLDDTREAQFPAFNDVKDQIKQRLEQTKLQDFQEKLRKSAKTDYKFSQ
jgi:peptidyl-prolyl cis-trans isomerase C